MPGHCLLPAGGEKSVNMHTANLSTVCKSTYPTLNFRKSRNKFLNCNNSVTQKVAILTFHAVLSLCNPDWTSTRWKGQIVTFCHIIHNKQSNLSNHQTTNHATIYKMPHLHLSSLVTKKKNRDRRYIFSFHLALMHISLPRTPVIYNKMCTSLPRSCCRSTRSDGRRDRKDGRRGRKDRHANRIPRDGSPNIHHLRPTTPSPPHQT